MPESPEVQALVEFVAAKAVGRTVQGFDILLPRSLKTADTTLESIIGCRVSAVARQGKLLDIALAHPGGTPLHVVVHWGHDGWLVWHDSMPEGTRRTGEATLIARVRLDEGSGCDLTDAGQWKALAIFVVERTHDVPAIAKLGRDPLDPGFTAAELTRLLGGRRKQLKALLQDQTVIAGIGNAYSDEILHAARLSPVVHAANLTGDDITRLHTAITGVLEASTVARRGLVPTELKDDKRANMRVHRRPGEECPVCGDTIVEFTFSGAAAHWCPTCQGGGDAPVP